MLHVGLGAFLRKRDSSKHQGVDRCVHCIVCMYVHMFSWTAAVNLCQRNIRSLWMMRRRTSWVVLIQNMMRKWEVMPLGWYETCCVLAPCLVVACRFLGALTLLAARIQLTAWASKRWCPVFTFSRIILDVEDSLFSTFWEIKICGLCTGSVGGVKKLNFTFW